MPWNGVYESDEKLASHFGRRENYVVHYANLKLYLEMGKILISDS